MVPSRLQVVVREEQFDPDTAIGGNTIRSHVLGLNYFIKGDVLKLMLDYLHGRVSGSAADGDRLLSRIQIVF